MRRISKAKLEQVAKIRPRGYLKNVHRYVVKEDATHLYMENHHFIRLAIKYRKKHVSLGRRIEISMMVIWGYIAFWPLFIFRAKDHRGLGDTTEAVIRKTIGNTVVKKKKRRGCGCNRRQKILNAVFPYNPQLN